MPKSKIPCISSRASSKVFPLIASQSSYLPETFKIAQPTPEKLPSKNYPILNLGNSPQVRPLRCVVLPKFGQIHPQFLLKFDGFKFRSNNSFPVFAQISRIVFFSNFTKSHSSYHFPLQFHQISFISANISSSCRPLFQLSSYPLS